MKKLSFKTSFKQKTENIPTIIKISNEFALKLIVVAVTKYFFKVLLKVPF